MGLPYNRLHTSQYFNLDLANGTAVDRIGHPALQRAHAAGQLGVRLH